jgi:putative FmdB family regulatory protein
MPLFDFLCLDCGRVNEILVFSAADKVECQACGSDHVRKMLSAVSSISGVRKSSLPGAGDTACCGASPATAGCAGPGSCCGKAYTE